MLHLQKLADALEGEIVGKLNHALWPSNIVESILFSSGTDDS